MHGTDKLFIGNKELVTTQHFKNRNDIISIDYQKKNSYAGTEYNCVKDNTKK